MSQQISQSTNSPTMKVILVQSKFILFRVVDSISLPPYHSLFSKIFHHTIIHNVIVEWFRRWRRQQRTFYTSFFSFLSISDCLSYSPPCYGTQNLNRIDQCTAEQDGKELGNNRRKITLRYAAKASYAGSSKREKISCGCSGDCHRRSGECPNKATGPKYTQITVLQ